MIRQRLVGRFVALLGIGACVITLPAAAAPRAATMANQGTRHAVVDMLDRMPLRFVPEQVSPDGAMGYAVRGNEASVWLSASGLSYRLHPASGVEDTLGSWVVALDLVGATPRRPVGEDLLPTKVSYFKGSRDQWRTGLPSYGSVVYHGPWPGIDLVVSGVAGELKSTFVVRPGVDPGQIRLAYRGATAVRLEADGSLVVDTPLGEIREQAPFAYQEVDGRRVAVAAAFALEPSAEEGRQGYRFRLGDYDPDRELVVDPVTLIYCGYIGGSAHDWGRAIAVDGAGNAYVTGWTFSPSSGFPVTVGPDLTYNGGIDVFVAKVNLDGTALDYCGYIGGSGDDWGEGIGVDAAGNAYVTGYTDSNEVTFPVAVGPDLTYNSIVYQNDAFVARVNPNGTSLDYCGYIGGSQVDQGSSIAVDTAGNAYITGTTFSTEATFPVSVGPDLTHNGSSDVFVAKVNPAGTALDYCGYIGGSGDDDGEGIALHTAGNAYVVGWTGSAAGFPVSAGPDLTFNGGLYDAFVAKVDPAGSALDYCGYVGGSEEDYGQGIAVDTAGNAHITGRTASDEATFPVAVGPDITFNGVGFDFDSFVARVNPNGTSLAYCGYIGGSDIDYGTAIAVDPAGNAYVTGYTDSTEGTFPVVAGPDLTHNGGFEDAYVAKVNLDGTALDYCGYIGGSDQDYGEGIALDSAGNAYITGQTASTEGSFPVTVGPDLSHNMGEDGFIAKIGGFLFGDGFESGETSAWSATVP